MRRVGIAWDKTRRLDGGRALGSMRDSKAACVCACPCLCGVHVLKPNRRQTRAAAWPECRKNGKQFVASNFFSGSWWGSLIDRVPAIDRQGSDLQCLGT